MPTGWWSLARVALAAVLCVLGPVNASGQSAAPADVPVSPSATEVPSPQNAIAAFNVARSWVLLGSTEGEAGIASDLEPELGVGGVSITLRYAGRVVGRGESFETSARAGLRHAVGDALKDAAERIPLARDEEMRLEQLRSVTLTLELAGPMTPIAPDALKDAAMALSPGIDGVAARLGDRLEAVFPEQMLMAGMDGHAALGSAAGAVTGAPHEGLRDPSRVRRDLGVTFLTFRTAHLTQPRAGDAPVFLYRGSRVPSERGLDVGALREMADGIATHLAGRVHEGAEPLGIKGTYLPVADRYESESAGAAEQGLAALALHTHANTPGIGAAARDRSRRAARRIVDDLAVVEPGEIAPEASLAGAAMASVSIRRITKDAERSGETAALLERCDARLDEWATGLMKGAGNADAARMGAEAGVAAWAIAERAATTGEGEDGAAVRRAANAVVREVFLRTPAAVLASQMPWLGWADGERPGESVPSAEALRQMRDMIWTHQLRAADAGSEGADLVGGIVFTSGGSPLPTWHSLRVLAFLSWMLGDDRLTDTTEAAPELSRVLAGLRFLRTLAADTATCHMYVAPERAMWGVRAAAWDQRMAPEASAMGLLTVCHALSSVSRIAERSTTGDGPKGAGESGADGAGQTGGKNGEKPG